MVMDTGWGVTASIVIVCAEAPGNNLGQRGDRSSCGAGAGWHDDDDM